MSDLETAARFAFSTLSLMRMADSNEKQARDDVLACLAKALHWQHGLSEDSAQRAWERALVITGLSSK